MPERLFLPPAILTFPERVLGRVGAHWIKSGAAKAPRLLRTWREGKGGRGGK